MVKKSVLILVPLLRRLFVSLYDTLHEFHLVFIEKKYERSLFLIFLTKRIDNMFYSTYYVFVSVIVD